MISNKILNFIPSLKDMSPNLIGYVNAGNSFWLWLPYLIFTFTDPNYKFCVCGLDVINIAV